VSSLLLVPLLLAQPPAGSEPDAPAPAPVFESAATAVDVDTIWDGPLRTVYPFNGHDQQGWEPMAIAPWRLDGPRGANLWTVGVSAPKPDDPGRLVIGKVDSGDSPELITPGKGADLATTERFGDMRVTLDYLLPQGSNAGVIPHGRYELQLLDADHGQARREAERSADALSKKGHLSVYGIAAPERMPDLATGRWHTLSFRFVAPRFDADGHKVEDARFEAVTVDGVEVLGAASLPGSTGRRKRGDETPTGPLVLQGDHGPVAFRNIKIETPAEPE